MIKKNQAKLFIVLLLAIIALLSFFLGANLGTVGTSPKSESENKPLSAKVIKGSYPITINGKVKDIGENFIIFENPKGEIIFTLKKNTTVLVPYNKASTPSAAVKNNIFRPKIPTTINSLKVGQIITAEVSITEKEVNLSTIHIINEK